MKKKTKKKNKSNNSKISKSKMIQLTFVKKQIIVFFHVSFLSFYKNENVSVFEYFIKLGDFFLYKIWKYTLKNL